MTLLKPFNPFPFLNNPHVQTVLGSLLSGAGESYPTTPRLLRMDDGDHVALHESFSRNWRSGDPIAILVHGLGGSHRSGYMQRVGGALYRQGVRVVRLDLRGAGASMPHSRKFYNAANSGDLRAVAAQLHVEHPASPLAVVGFSLGGNIALKFAGEEAAAPLPNLRAVAALAPPIDLVRCSEMMANHPWYDAFYVRHLIRQVRDHQLCFPDLPPIVFPRGLTLWQFDELYTAARWGYPDAKTYYRTASAYLPAIRVPTFVLTARDDPFVAVEPFERVAALPNLAVHIVPHGGHLGFVGRDGLGGIRWAETRLIEWVLARFAADAP